VEHANVEVCFGGKQCSGGERFGLTLGVEVNVVPTSKEIEFVPFGATMA
jgi:hypothetical protein